MATVRRSRRSPRFVLAAGVLVLPIACGDDDDSAATVTETATDAGTDDAPDAASAEIVIAGFAFSGTGTVPVGTTVTVQNTDDAQHTWTSVDDVFDSGALGAGQTFSFTFDEPGQYPYFCNFHPSMTGTIVVTG